MLNTATIAKKFGAITVEAGSNGKAVALDCRNCCGRPTYREKLCRRCYHRALHRLRGG